MSTPAAFRATVHGLRTVPTRKVVQVTIEAPIEQVSSIAAIAEHGAWVAVARLNEEAKEVVPTGAVQQTKVDTPPRPAELSANNVSPGGAKRSWSGLSYSNQAGILCATPMFQRFLIETNRASMPTDDDAAVAVRTHCLVSSRSDIRPNHVSGRLWRELVSEFRAWEMVPV